jgi:hypothetical protein
MIDWWTIPYKNGDIKEIRNPRDKFSVAVIWTETSLKSQYI